MEGVSSPHQKANYSFSKTSTSKCVGNLNKNDTMLCSKCGIVTSTTDVHSYQIQYFFANRRRNMNNFFCIDCVDVPNENTSTHQSHPYSG